jgi:pSer/pThr/pTyr-binding forkhead associated (FHA) protein
LAKKTYNNFMVFFLEVIDGPLAGSKYKIEEGVTIGRNRGEIVIEDAKISGAHAKFALDNKDQFILSDLGSANGILTGNRRVRKLAMMPGVVFRLGSTSFRVVEVEDSEKAESFAKIKTWKENLVEALLPEEVANQAPPLPLQAFSPTLRLTFLQGLQVGEKIHLGYGPRTAGAHSLDLDLLDPSAPDLAFQLIPGRPFATLKNLCDYQLNLNNKPVETAFLQEGDLIQVGKTQIRINYV